MRCLVRNRKSFYYALYKGKQPLTDDEGNLTGEYGIAYETPVKLRANISPASGDAQNEIFGINAEYERVIVTEDLSCPIDEKTILFIEVEPSKDSDGNWNNDYVVSAVGKSLNSISIAISKSKDNENQS